MPSFGVVGLAKTREGFEDEKTPGNCVKIITEKKASVWSSLP